MLLLNIKASTTKHSSHKTVLFINLKSEHSLSSLSHQRCSGLCSSQKQGELKHSTAASPTLVKTVSLSSELCNPAQLHPGAAVCSFIAAPKAPRRRAWTRRSYANPGEPRTAVRLTHMGSILTPAFPKEEPGLDV